MHSTSDGSIGGNGTDGGHDIVDHCEDDSDGGSDGRDGDGEGGAGDDDNLCGEGDGDNGGRRRDGCDGGAGIADSSNDENDNT